MRVGLVVNLDRGGVIDAAVESARGLSHRGAEVAVMGDSAENAAVDLAEVFDGLAVVVTDPEFPAGCDLVLSLGGDGTFLRAAHLCRDANVPLMGVNLGHLGFLAEVERDGLDQALDVIVAGAWIVERRMTLDVRIEDESGAPIHHDWALNEVSIEKKIRQRLIRMQVKVGEETFAQVAADALVVATPTGSTAYALSAGGPIVSPRVAACLIVPVAPHSLFDRTLLAAADEAVRIQLQPEHQEGLVSCDGRDPVLLTTGQTLVATGADRDLQVARVRPAAFYELVRRKFGLR